jgi:hypothetical protein
MRDVELEELEDDSELKAGDDTYWGHIGVNIGVILGSYWGQA